MEAREPYDAADNSELEGGEEVCFDDEAQAGQACSESEGSAEELDGDSLEIATSAVEDDAEGRLAGELELHDGDASYALDVKPNDCSIIASGGGDDKMVVFKVVPGQDGGEKHLQLSVEVVAVLEGHTDTVEHVKFSRSGGLLASGSLDGTVRVYETTSYGLLYVLEGPGDEVNWMQWSPSRATLAVGFSDGSVWIFSCPPEVDSATCERVLSGRATTSTCGAFTSDGRSLVCGGDGILTVWSVSDGQALVTYGGGGSGGSFPRDNAISIQVHGERPIAIVGFAEGAVLVIHLEHRETLATLATPPAPARAEDDEEMADGEEEEGERRGVERVGFIASRTLPIAYAGSLNGTLAFWDANNYRQRAILSDVAISAVSTVALVTSSASSGRKGEMILAGSADGTIAAWDVLTGRQEFLIACPRSREPSPTHDDEMDEDSDQTNIVFDLLQIGTLPLIAASFDDGKVRIYRTHA